MLSQLRRFQADRSGNFAMMVAVAGLPLALCVGMALDVSTIHRARSELQEATDAAVLAIAREGVAVSDQKAQEIADNLVAGNFHGGNLAIKVRRAGTSFTVEASGAADTKFGNLFGYDRWKVGALSSADIALVPYEIALVLDTTGSMRGGKLQAMKDAVVGLVDTMSANVTVKENLKFALVPFSNFVNVGPQFAPKFDKKGKVVKGTGAPWLDLKGKSGIPQLEFAKDISRFEVFHNLGVDWAGCVETREPTKKAQYDVTDIAANSKKPESLFVPALSIDDPDDASVYANSYIKSDIDPLDKTLTGKLKKALKYGLTLTTLLPGDDEDDDDDSGTGSNDGSEFTENDGSWSPVSSTITPAKGPNANCVSQPISALSTQYQDMKTKVEALQANGNTNIMEGVAWGWRVLSPEAPFTEGAPRKGKVRRIMIVLTDGSNVYGVTTDKRNKLGSVYSSFGFAVDERLLPFSAASSGSTNTAMNEKTLAACTNAKADGVEIFTIRLEEPNKTTGMMLKECASAPDHFFDAPSRSQLDEVFGQIRDRINSIRLSS